MQQSYGYVSLAHILRYASAQDFVPHRTHVQKQFGQTLVKSTEQISPTEFDKADLTLTL